MLNDIFSNLVKVLDTEIKQYTDLRDFYTKKRELLVKNQVLDLAELDAKIIETYESIQKVDSQRVELTNKIGDNLNCMSDLIKVAQVECPNYVHKLKDRQGLLENLSRSISVLNLTNMDLINHGMVVTDKKLGIIVDACTPKANSYNSKGLETDKDLSMSTIIQDV